VLVGKKNNTRNNNFVTSEAVTSVSHCPSSYIIEFVIFGAGFKRYCKDYGIDHCCRGRSKPGCRFAGSAMNRNE